MQEFFVFVSAVAEHWVGLMGGAAIVVVSLFERVRRNLPTWVWIVLASGFVFWATFQAWQDQFHETEKARRELADSVTREASLKAEGTEKDKRISALEVSLHGRPSANPEVTVNVPRPIVRVVPGADARPHPPQATISVSKTEVKHDLPARKVTVELRLDSGRGDTEANVEVFLLDGTSSNRIERRALSFVTGKAYALTMPLNLTEGQAARLEKDGRSLGIRVVATYGPPAEMTEYVLEGTIRKDLNHLDIQRTTHRPLRSLR